ncbi:hypothetical protein ACWIUD_01340 [Helicobacter sp. 23-1044]
MRKETSESNPKNGVDSANQTKNAESHAKSQNLKRDSSPTAQNDKKIWIATI